MLKSLRLLLIALASLLVMCGRETSNLLEEQYFGTLDSWVTRGGPMDELQGTLVETCGKLVMITVGTSEKAAFSTTQREEFHFRVDVCTKMTVNRVYPQPEFEKEDVVATICDKSEVTLFSKLCRRNGLR